MYWFNISGMSPQPRAERLRQRRKMAEYPRLARALKVKEIAKCSLRNVSPNRSIRPKGSLARARTARLTRVNLAG
jgi:hypothetical protein